MSEQMRVLLAGTGPMAKDYAMLLRQGLGWEFDLVSRTKEKALQMADEFGAGAGLTFDEACARAKEYSFAIVACAIDASPDIASQFISAGVKALLLEKPVGLLAADSERIAKEAERAGALVRVAYNRRYYASVLELKSLLAKDSAVTGFFDFTEWASQIADLPKSDFTKSHWAIANSIHVFDTFLFLLGTLRDVNAIVADPFKLAWHPSAATFVGSGYCGATPVSWCTSWLAPGRWNIEVMTTKGRYKLSPMEKLQFLPHNSVEWKDASVDYSWDQKFKPGLYKMVQSFAELLPAHGANESRATACRLPTCAENARTIATFSKIVGYK